MIINTRVAFNYKMSLLKEDELEIIATKCGYNYESIQYELQNYSDELVGYLGEHLRLILKLINKEKCEEMVLFVKCIPRFDKYKAQYLSDCGFFEKEYVLLSSLFSQFTKREGTNKWRPELLYEKPNVLVFEDVTQIGYAITDCRKPFTYDQTVATIEAVAKFHADSIIFEHQKSKKLKRPYKIWDDYSKYLKEPSKGQPWRDTGRNAIIDVLKVYSAYKDRPNFSQLVENIVPRLCDEALELMKPSSTYRNVVVHRDIWSNNVFFKTLNNGATHALIVDYQTALYASPMLDLTSLMFLNTTKKFRSLFTEKMLDVYYTCLSQTLKDSDVNFFEYFDREKLLMAYRDYIVFAITQAAIILPIANMPENKKTIYCKKNSERFDSITRSDAFIESIEEDENYREWILELFDDLVERYVLPINKDYINNDIVI